MAKRVLYLQSGGPTAVINTTAVGAILAAREQGCFITAARFGLTGLEFGDLIDLDALCDDDIMALANLPGACFGACRSVLNAQEEEPLRWENITKVLREYKIDTILLNGGNGSMLTALHLDHLCKNLDWPCSVIGLPKTIDNDLENTAYSPGFLSSAKYLALSAQELVLDMNSLGRNRVVILEAMGRNAGWLAAAAGSLFENSPMQPIILVPEHPYVESVFFERVKTQMATFGQSLIVVAEGVVDSNGDALATQSDPNGSKFKQLGGVGAVLAAKLKTQAPYHVHVAVADCLQRAARHCASSLDLVWAYDAGAYSVELAMQGISGVMVNMTYDYVEQEATLAYAPLDGIADLERKLPDNFFDKERCFVTSAFFDYMRPLIDEIRAEHATPTHFPMWQKLRQ